MFDTSNVPCKGKTELFFNERTRRGQYHAKTICRKCDKKAECLDYAVNNHIFFGVWGGLNSKEIEAQRRLKGIVLEPHYGYTRVRRERKNYG
tara:strand:+ start:302 stop:577 length:276 start_codon:yes stop_codon:yes gene_type:complete